MLILLRELFSSLEGRIDALFTDDIARDPETGAYLCRSRGRSRVGRSYYLYILQHQREHKSAIRIKATSDGEAVAIANSKLAKMSIEAPTVCSLCRPLFEQTARLYKCPNCGEGWDRLPSAGLLDLSQPPSNER